jgi:hypothetical protein
MVRSHKHSLPDQAEELAHCAIRMDTTREIEREA